MEINCQMNTEAKAFYDWVKMNDESMNKATLAHGPHQPNRCSSTADGVHCYHPGEDSWTEQVCCWCGKKKSFIHYINGTHPTVYWNEIIGPNGGAGERGLKGA